MTSKEKEKKKKAALSAPTRLMIIGTGRLIYAISQPLAVATGTSCIYNLSKVVEREEEKKTS